MVPTRQFLMIPRLMLCIKKHSNTMSDILKHGINFKNADNVSLQVLERWCETWTLKNKTFNIFSWKCLKTLNSILVCYLYDKLADTYEFKERTLFKCPNINIKKEEYIQSTYDVDAIESLNQECNDAKKMQAPNYVCEWYSQLRHKS